MADIPNLFNLDPLAFQLSKQNRGGQFRGITQTNKRRQAELASQDQLVADPRAALAIAAPNRMQAALQDYSNRYMGAVRRSNDMQNAVEQRQMGKQVLSVIPYAKLVNLAGNVANVMGREGGVNDRLTQQAQKMNDPVAELTFDFNRKLDNWVGDVAGDIQDFVGDLFGGGDSGPSWAETARATRPQYIASDAQKFAAANPDMDVETAYNTLMALYGSVKPASVHYQTTTTGKGRGRKTTTTKTSNPGSSDPLLASLGLSFDDYLVDSDYTFTYGKKPNSGRRGGSHNASIQHKAAMTPQEQELFKQALQIQYGSIAAEKYQKEIDAENARITEENKKIDEENIRRQQANQLSEQEYFTRLAQQAAGAGSQQLQIGDILANTSLYSEQVRGK